MPQLLQFLLFLICIATFTFNALAQSRWSLVGGSVDNAIWLVDKTTKNKTYGFIQAWEKVVYQDGSYSIALNEWKCSEKMKRLMQVNNYDPTGDILDRSLIPLPWRYVVPDSIEEKTFKIVCNSSSSKESKIGSNKKAVPKSSFAQVIAKKANLMSDASSNSEVIRELSLGEKLVLVSDDSVGVWYQVLDPKTNSQGWLNGNHFKIVKAKKPVRKVTRNSRK